MAAYKKIYSWGKILLWTFLALSGSIKAFAQPSLSASDTQLNVEPTTVNYYLNTLVGEDEYYADSFYNDFLITLGGKKILQFTRDINTDELIDLYFYVQDRADLKIVYDYFTSHRQELDKISPKIVPVFLEYENFMGK